MRTLLVRLSAIAAAVLVLTVNAADRALPPIPLETLDAVLRDFASIYPGLTRAEVSSVLKRDGGMSTATTTRFVHPLCLYCKVTITFEPASRSRSGTPESDQDKVKSVTKPYLEPMALD